MSKSALYRITIPSFKIRGTELMQDRTALRTVIRTGSHETFVLRAREGSKYNPALHAARRHYAEVAKTSPIERAGVAPRTFQASAKPDHYLDSRYLSHPIPQLDHGSPAAAALTIEDGQLRLSADLEGLSIPISGRWLRDNCACKQCRNTDTAQRQINVFKESGPVTVTDFDYIDGSSFAVTFSDGHRSVFPYGLITQHNHNATNQSRLGVTSITTWTADIASAPPSVSFESIANGSGMSELLRNIRTYGFSFLDGIEATPEASEQFLCTIGPIRDTHYGAFYDFTADLASKDTAYTSESLEPHTDNTYFTEPAGLQALHLLSHTHGSGGESSLVDGFGAALQLFVEDKDAYLLLSRTGVYAHASGNDGISIQPAQAFPTLSHDPQFGFLTQVRWNNADRAGVAAELQDLDAWYDAAGKFDAILSKPENQYWFQLKPGRMLIFDNWRALHGRASFTGKRRICGGYINRDDFISRYRMTNLSQEEIQRSTVTG